MSLVDKKLKQQYDKKFYKENIDKIKERNKKWFKEHPEKKRAYYKIHYYKHIEKIHAKARKDYANNPSKFRKKHEKWKKDNPERYKEALRKHRQNNHEKIKANDRERIRLVKLRVLTYYSHGTLTCACCGESMYQFLTLDHIHNNGAQDRKNGLNSTNLGRLLIKNNYPEGFRVLCYNCNCGRSKNKDKICPHKSQLNNKIFNN